MNVERGITLARQHVTDALYAQTNVLSSGANQESDKALLQQVATISANNDEVIGSVLATVITRVGEHGVVTIEEGGDNVDYSITDGMSFERGYISPHFVLGDERAKMEVVLEDAYVLICEKKLTSYEEILPIIEKVVADKDDRGLLVIAEMWKIEPSLFATKSFER